MSNQYPTSAHVSATDPSVALVGFREFDLRLADGRHWLTISGAPPLQLVVAANHIRAGTLLLRTAAMAVAARGCACDEAMLTADDAAPVRATSLLSFNRPYRGKDPLPVCFVGHHEMADLARFGARQATPALTLRPTLDWTQDFDAWVAFAARTLGIDAPDASTVDGIGAATTEAVRKPRSELPLVADRFRRGLRLHETLYVKVRFGSAVARAEDIWVAVVKWSRDGMVRCRADEMSVGVRGLRPGRLFSVNETEIIDYVVEGSANSEYEGGHTLRVSFDYGAAPV